MINKTCFQIIILTVFLKKVLLYEDYYEIKICSEETCPYPSLCISETICKCKEGFYNLNFDNNYSNKCKYKMKSRNLSFWIEIITNIGIGHIIIGNYKIGICKLFYLTSTLCFFYYSCMSEKNSLKYLNDDYHLGICIINFLLCLGVFIWWLVDSILFGINKYKDGNGFELFNN